jgi:hypothetical protein
MKHLSSLTILIDKFKYTSQYLTGQDHPEVQDRCPSRIAISPFNLIVLLWTKIENDSGMIYF